MIGLGCHSRNYGPGTPDEIFGLISKLEFEYIDVDAVGTIKQADVLERPQETGRLVKELAERHGLKLAEYFMGGVLVHGEGISPSHPKLQLRDEMYVNFDRVCKFAHEAGFTSIMGAAGVCQPEIGFELSFQYAADVLRRMVAIGNDHGIAFHVEPNRHSLLDTPAKALQMAELVAGLKYTVDFLHYQVNGFPQSETMALLRYAGHMHARQAAVDWPKCPFEHGEIDYDRIVKRLTGLNWNGVIAMEFWNGPAEAAAGMSPIEETILMRRHLKQLIKKYHNVIS
jgi:sugar phosphate isomerase/epimerase